MLKNILADLKNAKLSIPGIEMSDQLFFKFYYNLSEYNSINKTQLFIF